MMKKLIILVIVPILFTIPIQACELCGITKIENKSPHWVEIVNERAGNEGTSNKVFIERTLPGGCNDKDNGLWINSAPLIVKPNETMSLEGYAIPWQDTKSGGDWVKSNEKIKVSVWSTYPIPQIGESYDFPKVATYIQDIAGQICYGTLPSDDSVLTKSNATCVGKSDKTLTVSVNGQISLN